MPQLPHFRKFSLRVFCSLLFLFLLTSVGSLAFAGTAESLATTVSTAISSQGAATAENGASSTGSAAMWINPIFWALPLIFFLLWVYTTNWASKDAQILEEAVLEYKKWNPILVISFLVFWFAHYLIPIIWVGLPLIFLGWLVPILIYCLAYRNPLVEDHQKVLTKDHLRFWFATKLKIGSKERIDPRDIGAITLVPASKESQENTTRNFVARESAGYVDTKQFIADALGRRADAVMLDYTAESVGLRFLVDGLWAAGEAIPREQGDAILETLKLLCGLNPEERRAKQEGKLIGQYFVFRPAVFKAIDKKKDKYRQEESTLMIRKMSGGELSTDELEKHVRMEVDAKVRERFSYGIGPWTPVEKKQLAIFGDACAKIHPDNSVDKRKCTIRLTSAGTQTGERVLLEIQLNKIFYKTLGEIGMRPKMEEQFREVLRKRTGIFCFCGSHGTGLRTTVNVSLEVADRLTREFFGIEDENMRYDPIENLEITPYDLAKGDDPCTILDGLFHREPDVMIMRDIPSKEAAIKLFEHSQSRIEGIVSVRAPDCFEAIFHLIKMGIPAQLVAESINGVLNQRLVRKLCEYCREPFVPTPQMLTQLGIPAGKVDVLYRQAQPDPEHPDSVCPECAGNGYVGRTAIFEFLEITEEMRQAIASGQATPQGLRAMAKKNGMTNFQEEGIALFARGITSFDELRRVLKG